MADSNNDRKGDQTVNIPRDVILKIANTQIDGQPIENALVFHVQSTGEPIIVKAQPEILIGRRTFRDNVPPAVDLKPHDGAILGVSRHHARVFRQNDQWVIEDLNSANGTWVNKNELTANEPSPLHSGDVLRLGSCVITVYI